MIENGPSHEGMEKIIERQAEQIKRLQDAVVAWREVIEERYNNDLLADLVDDGIITAEDMEEQ